MFYCPQYLFLYKIPGSFDNRLLTCLSTKKTNNLFLKMKFPESPRLEPKFMQETDNLIFGKKLSTVWLLLTFWRIKDLQLYAWD